MMSATLTASMPRARNSRAAASTIFCRVSAASSRDFLMLHSAGRSRVQTHLLSEGAIEHPCGKKAAQLGQQTRVLADRIAEARLLGGERSAHRGRHQLGIVAVLHLHA